MEGGKEEKKEIGRTIREEWRRRGGNKGMKRKGAQKGRKGRTGVQNRALGN